MNTKTKPQGKSAFTLLELLVLLVIVSTLGFAFLLYRADARRKSDHNHSRCNLRQLGTGMIQYIDQYGKGKYYTWPGTQTPTFNGAQWIASMYWTSLLNEPDLYVCGTAPDENDKGGRLGRRFTTLGPGDVSFAGRNGIMGAITDKMPSNTLMMSDDSEGEPNHEGGVTILFFDAHVEFTAQVSPLPGGVGFKKPVDMLRN